MSTKLLNTDGSSAIAWASIDNVSRFRTLAADGTAIGGRADVRAGAQRVVKRWRMRANHATGAEVDLVRQALEESGWGAGTVKWRHPLLDPAAAAVDCPEYRIVGSSFSFGRGPGGVMGDIELTLEEV